MIVTHRIHGKPYTLIGQKRSTLGGKFFNKFVFTLRAENGEIFQAFGKAIAHNSTLTKVES